MFAEHVASIRVASDQCRILAFPATLSFAGERLINHTIANISVIDRDTCKYCCYLNYNCVSVNFYFGENEAEAHNCELNNSTAKEYDEDLVKEANYVYYGTKNFCAQSPCKNSGTCQSGFTRKQYRCLCASGFTGHDCEIDIDECVLNSHDSGEDASCINTEGSYNCFCNNPGFRWDGRECKDIDECLSNAHTCSKHSATCTNTEGSFNCSCNPGFTGDGHNCQDIDECAKNIHNCSKNNATCFNSMGSFNCSCNAGFRGDGYNCSDIDECAENIHNCSKNNTTCTNSKGSFNCFCNPGFRGDGYNCTVRLASIPEMPAESCGEIKASEQAMAASGKYWLEPREKNVKSKKFLGYCDMVSLDQAWTLLARFSNSDTKNWMIDSGYWWYDSTEAAGDTADPSYNADMISPAFWLISGSELKITRSDDSRHTPLLQKTANCLSGLTFRSKITSYGDFRNGSVWSDKKCLGKCKVRYGGQYLTTEGFGQASCSGDLQAADEVGFWCDWD
ncbi:Fibrillin-1 [Stylophora pistillata]|uniref:Fibrillin-1 n=1 Tax=Stylophora pistillata TaxID=50429 RepID=A0A2B4RED5_STYPI|nr:Fibrillin-1 [Stylophora pistillata]